MKTWMHLTFRFMSFAGVLTLFSTGEVVIYPTPGDLSTVSHLKKSADYSVKVNGQPVFVYTTENYWTEGDKAPEYQRPEKGASFTSFGLGGQPVDVEVTLLMKSDKVKIRPARAGIQVSKSGPTVRFKLSPGQKIALETDDALNPLMIFPDPISPRDSRATMTFGPGVHKIADKTSLPEGARVWLDGGAVVEGTFVMGNNVTIQGPGILTAGHIRRDDWTSDKKLSPLTYKNWTVKNHTYDGFILVNSPGWMNNGQVQDSSIKNMKMISWCGNSDAPHLGGTSVMEDCFILNNDDALIGNDGTDNAWRNCIVWMGPWGHAIVALQAGPREPTRFLWENIDVIGATANRAGARGPLIGFQPNFYNKAAKANLPLISNMVVRNLRVEAPSFGTLLKVFANGIAIKDLVFENITVDSTGRQDNQIEGKGGGLVSGVIFRKLIFGGAPVSDLAGAGISSSGSTSGVELTAGTPNP